MKPLIPARLLGAFSAVLLALGATGPLAKATLITAYLNDVSTARVVLLLIIAAVALVLSVQGKTRLLRWTALAAVLTLASLGLGGGDDKYIPIVSDVLKLIMDVLKSVFTDVAKAIVHLQWGGYCLLSGLLLMGGTGFIKAEADAG
jgi:hypothetical protein